LKQNVYRISVNYIQADNVYPTPEWWGNRQTISIAGIDSVPSVNLFSQ